MKRGGCNGGGLVDIGGLCREGTGRGVLGEKKKLVGVEKKIGGGGAGEMRKIERKGRERTKRQERKEKRERQECLWKKAIKK